MGLTLNQTATVQANYSVTKREETVTILELDFDGYAARIQYTNGYEEWLPFTAFQEF